MKQYELNIEDLTDTELYEYECTLELNIDDTITADHFKLMQEAKKSGLCVVLLKNYASYLKYRYGKSKMSDYCRNDEIKNRRDGVYSIQVTLDDYKIAANNFVSLYKMFLKKNPKALPF